jgi:ABC-2 type transport system permease protein
MNLRAVWAIYYFEMARTGRTLLQSILSPVISTCLYFVVFGAAIGSRITEIEGIAYGAFIVPGLIMLMLLTQSTANASFGIYFPKFVGTIYELLSAPVSYFEIVLGYVGAAATKSIILGLLILATAGLFVPLQIAHPFWMLAFLVLTAVTFSLFGFILGIWADGFEKLQVVPLLVITPLTFLGGTFYSIQSRRLSDQRFPLELFRDRRRERRREPGHDVAVPGPVPGGRVVDFQDRLSDQAINAPCAHISGVYI